MSFAFGGLNDAVKKVALREGIENVQITKHHKPETRSGFLSDVLFIDVQGVKNEKSVSLKCVVKCAPKAQDEDKEETVIDYRLIYKTEQYMYSVVLKELLKLQNEHGINNASDALKALVKCHYAGNDMLILENLKEQGFDMYEKGKRFDKEHLCALLKAFGKYHALNFAYKLLHPEKYKEIAAKLSKNFLTKFYGKSNGIPEKIIDKVCAHMRKNGNEKLADEFKKFGYEYCNKRMCKEFVERNEYSIISHGDAWCNNFMFRYNHNNENEAIDVKIFDWQNSLYTSTAVDVAMLIWLASDPIYYKDADYFIKVYHEALIEHLKKFGFDGERVFPFDELKRELPRGSRLSVISALFIFRVLIVDDDEAPDLTEAKVQKEGEVTAENPFTKKLTNEDQYLDMCERLIEHLNNLGYLKIQLLLIN